MNNLIVLSVALPLLMAFLIPVVNRYSSFIAAFTGPLVLLFLIWLTACIAANLPAAQTAYSIAIGGFLPPQGIVFYVDRLALLFAFAVPVITLLMWPWRSDLDTEGRGRQLALMMVLVAACSGLALSGDLFNLYVFYELVAVASYGLIVTTATAPSYVAAYRYLLVSAAGSVLALLGIAMIYFATGTLNLAHLATLAGNLDTALGLSAFAMLLLGFGVKAELFPLNGWVPEVYMASSRRVAGLLAGLVSKLAVLVIVKTLLTVFDQPQAYQMLLILGLTGLVIGELSAFKATDMTRMLAWSSIGQLGLVFIAFSIPGQAGMLAGLAIVLHHLIVKPGLFMLAERWGHRFEDLKGAAKRSPLMAVVFIVFALSLMGVPPLPGFWAKFMLLTGLAETGSSLSMLAIALVLIMTVIEAAYLFRVMTLLYDRQAEAKTAAHAVSSAATALFMVLVLVTAVVFIKPLSQGMQTVAVQATDRAAQIQITLGQTAGDKP